MPNEVYASGSYFDNFKCQLGIWLRTYVDFVRPLKKGVIDKYHRKNIVAGWSATDPQTNHSFLILLPASFPLSKVRIAYLGEDMYLKWPHVEENGLLCLPEEGYLPIENLEYSIRETMNDANNLIQKCQSPQHVREESSKEFLSYWNRASKINALSLIDPSNTQPRQLPYAKLGNTYLVGESEEAITDWQKNSDKPQPTTFGKAIFCQTSYTPELPLLNSSKKILDTILPQAKEVTNLFRGINPLRSTLLIFCNQTNDGIGLFGAEISVDSLNGFRRPQKRKTKRSSSKKNIDTISIWKLKGKVNLTEAAIFKSPVASTTQFFLNLHTAYRD